MKDNFYVNTRLIFHFYLPCNWKELSTVKIHLNCLEKYIPVFDETIFVISMDNINDTNTITEFENKILSMSKNGNITFKVRENTILCESKTLYDEITSKLDTLDGLTFFGHSKGIGNEINCKKNGDWELYKDNIYIWIVGLYYLSLNDVSEVQSNLLGVWGSTFGSYKSTWDELDNKNKWIYSGTFFWINCKRLYDKINRNGINVRSCSNRFFSELYLGDILPIRINPDATECCSHNDMLLYNNNNAYFEIDGYTKAILSEDEYKQFNEIKKNMINNV